MCKKLAYLIPLVSLLSLIGGVANAGVLVGHWKLDEGSGNTARDSSGNNFHGTLMGTPQWVAGKIDGALELNGTTDYVLTSPINLNSNTVTMTAWVRRDGDQTGWAGIVFHRSSIACGMGFSGQAINELQYHWNDNSAATYNFVSGLTVPNNEWAFVAVVIEPSQATLYVNGSGNSSTNAIPHVAQALGAIDIGQDNNGDRFVNGAIDDVRIYSRALTAGQIEDLFNGIAPAWPKAYSPDPEDGATDVTTPLLQWQAGDTAASHDVYFGTDPDALEFVVRYPGVQTVYYHSPGVTPGTTYYWRIDEVEADGTTIHTGDVWSFMVSPLGAWNFSPVDGAEDVFTEVTLGWSPGQATIMYNLYFADDFDAVNDGATEADKGIMTQTSYQLGLLYPETVYYWRVDASDGNTWYTGDVVSFTTIPGGTGRIIREWWLDIGAGNAIGDLTGNPNYPDNPTGWEFVDMFEGPVDWDDNYGSRLRGWLFPPATGDYIFWFASDNGGQLWLSTDEDPANKVMIAEVPGTDWTSSREWEKFPEQKSAPISLEEGKVYYIEAMMKEGGGGDNIAVAWQGPIGTRQVISAEYVGPTAFAPVRAYSPRPGDGATDVTETATLGWLAGANAAQHDVFFDTDRDAVANADTTTAGIYRGRQALAATSYVPTESPLAWDTTYYWRIDEVNGVYPDAPWKGNIWSFTTANFIIVEDFEEYDDFCNRIFYTWADGWGYSADPDCGVTASTGNGTGSTVGNLNPPFAEQTIVHGGIQSMPFEYNNGASPFKSEASREFATPQNWARNEVKALTLWFRGETGNAPDTLYVAVEDNLGQVRVTTHPNPEALQVPDWQQWNIALQQFSGVNLASVKKIYLGVGNRNNPQMGGSGKLYIDDIRVYPARCVPSLAKPALDLSDNCIVDYADVEIISDQWLDSGFVVTPVDPGNSGLIAHYPFNGNANDVVGGNNGTTSGIVSYTTGKVGQAILLDGLDDYAGTTESLLNDMSAFTLAGWVSARNPTDSRIGLFGQNDAIEFGFDGGNISIWTAGGGSAAAPWTLMDFMWHHVAAVGDGTSLNVYVDGQLAASGGSTTDNYGTSTYFFNIGGGGVWDDVDNWLSGKIDEVYVYNRALSDGEVASLAGHTSPLSIPADLYQDDVIDFKDLAVLGDSWLDKVFWP